MRDKQLKSLEGRRVTGQRLLLLNLIQEAEGHLDADELYRRAKEREPKISLATVYRSLRLFKDLGLIEERHFAEEHHHYEATASSEHFHLVCLGCGEVVDFTYPISEQIRRDVAREKDFEITGAEITLEGYCSDCRKTGK